MKAFSFLINPISGGGKGKVVHQFLPEIMRSMDFKEDEWSQEFTDSNILSEQIKNSLRNTECLIAVGGDGTVSAVFQTLLESPEFSKVKIGLVPLGTGNDLARTLNLYDTYVNKGLLFLIRKLILSHSRPFDLWKVNDKKVMANYFSGGLDARVAYDFNNDRKTGKFSSSSVIKNKLYYVKKFFDNKEYSLRSGEVRITKENGEKKIISLKGKRSVIIGNIPSFAGGSHPFGKSDSADGLLEVVIVPSMFKFLQTLSIICFKKDIIKAKEIEIDFKENEYLQIDGEDISGNLQMPIRITYGGQAQLLYL